MHKRIVKFQLEKRCVYTNLTSGHHVYALIAYIRLGHRGLFYCYFFKITIYCFLWRRIHSV